MNIKYKNDYILISKDEKDMTNYTKIIKTKDSSILCYKGESLVSAYRGITDIENYSIEGGEFSEEEDTQEQKLAKLISSLIVESKKKDIEIKKNQAITKTLAKTIAKLNLDLNKKVENNNGR